MRLLPSKAADRLKTKKGKTTEADADWFMVKEDYDLGLEARRPFEQRWILNLAFLGGRQYTFFNSSAHILQQIRKVKSQRRKVDNQIIWRWNRQVADLVKTQPQMGVVPNTTEDEDIKAAKVGTKALESFWRTNRMKKQIRLLAGWMFSCGNGFMDDRWNPKSGPISIDKEGNPVYSGDVECGIWSPFEIVVPAFSLGDVDIHSFPWMIKSKWRTLDYIVKHYPERGEDVASEDHPSKLIDMNIVLGRVAGNASTKNPGAILHNYYKQPCQDHPEGAFIVASNGVVLSKQPYPFEYYHMDQFKDIDIPGVFWGKATTEDAIPLQIRWNTTLNDVDEFNRTMAKGKMLIPKGSRIEVTMDDTHGEQISYKPVMGHKPEQLNIKSLPPTITLMLDATSRSFQDLYSKHEVSRGTNKSDIRSGEMVDLLLEQDAHGNIPSHTIFEESLEAVMSRVLKRMSTGYTAGRMIKIVGRDGEIEVSAFKGADLRNNTDVSVKRQSSLPDSRVARQNQILKRYEVGLYGDPRDPEVRRHVMSMLDDAVVKDIYSDTKLDEAFARHENEIMRTGEINELLVNAYDNHQLHLKEHNRFRKGMDYQKIKFQNPQAFITLETIFGAHLVQHQKFVEEQMKQMLAMQAVMGGDQGGKNRGQGTKSRKPVE